MLVTYNPDGTLAEITESVARMATAQGREREWEITVLVREV
jgi:hypothetical protein